MYDVNTYTLIIILLLLLLLLLIIILYVNIADGILITIVLTIYTFSYFLIDDTLTYIVYIKLLIIL